MPRGPYRLVMAFVAAAVLVGSPVVSRAAAPRSAPSVTVVGFGVVNVAPAPQARPQLEFNLSTHGATASAALAAFDRDARAIERRLQAMGLKPSAFVLQGAPQLNFITTSNQASCRKAQTIKPGLQCQKPGYSAGQTLQVSFPTLVSLAAVLSRTHVVHRAGVQNFWIGQGNAPAARPSAAALAKGYRQALADARRTAIAVAEADGLVLGPAVRVTEGEGSSAEACAIGGCGAMVGLSPPPTGPNQMLLAVTVTYVTARRGA